MLNAETILPLLEDTENECTERTISTDAKEKFGQAICAFANDIMNTGKPGYLFIGANNDGSRSGFMYTDDFQKKLHSLSLPRGGMLISGLSSWKARTGSSYQSFSIILRK